MSELTPIVVFCYNRVRHLSETLSSLIENDEYHESPLFIFVDGPKDDEDEKNILKVKSFIESRSWNRNTTSVKRKLLHQLFLKFQF